MQSVTTAFKFAGAVVTFFIAGGAVLLGAHSLSTIGFVGLVVSACFTFPIAYVVCELERRGQQEDALRRLLDAERTYDALIADARRERDEAVAERNASQLLNAMLPRIRWPEAEAQELDEDEQLEPEPKPQKRKAAVTRSKS